ncbi:MAG: hypothetical protein IJU03_04115 [Thermoguttaceae bacterium]|nr:hypothetical protein [Thermoguttaceae bacterium]
MMDGKIRYDLFYMIELNQYTNYIRNLAWALRRPYIIENFIEDLSNGRSKDYYAVDPPNRYYIDAYDRRYIKSIKASYYDHSFREQLDSPYLGITTVVTEEVVHRCPHFNLDAVSMLDDGYEITYVDYIGSKFSKGFIPINERDVSCFFFSDEFHSRLRETDFNLGDQISPIDIFSEQSKISISDHSYVSNGLDLLYKLNPTHYTGWENERRYFSKSVFKCDKCGYGNCFCPQCCSYLIKCPNCGAAINITNIVFPEEEGTELDCGVFSKLAQSVYFDASEDEWRDIQTHSINGRRWGGLDLFYLGCDSPLWYQPFCSGRFAKWLVENQLGPISLIKYPVDVSECNEEELARLNAIAYGEPYVPEQ